MYTSLFNYGIFGGQGLEEKGVCSLALHCLALSYRTFRYLQIRARRFTQQMGVLHAKKRYDRLHPRPLLLFAVASGPLYVMPHARAS